MSLTELVTKIKKTRLETTFYPDDMDYRTRASIESVQRRAKDDLPILEQQYMSVLVNSMLVISLTGEDLQSFATHAKELGVPAFDHKQAITDIMAEMTRRRTGDRFGTTEAGTFTAIILDVKNKIKLAYMPPLDLSGTMPPIYGATTEDAIRRSIEHSYGTDLYDAYTLRAAQEAALQAEFDGKVFPILVYGYEESTSSGSTLKRPSFEVVAKAGATAADVKSELTKIKNSLKRSSKGSSAKSAPAPEQNDEPTENEEKE